MQPFANCLVIQKYGYILFELLKQHCYKQNTLRPKNSTINNDFIFLIQKPLILNISICLLYLYVAKNSHLSKLDCSVVERCVSLTRLKIYSKYYSSNYHRTYQYHGKQL